MVCMGGSPWLNFFFFLAEHYELYMIFIGGGRTKMWIDDEDELS